MAYRAPTNQAGRNALARARGFKSFFNYRRAIRNRRAPTPARVEFGDGIEHVNTRNEGTLRAAMRRAARRDLTLYPSVTILVDNGDPDPGTWPTRTVDLWGSYGYSAELAVANMGDRYAFGFIRDELDALEKYPGPVLSVLLRADIADQRAGAAA